MLARSMLLITALVVGGCDDRPVVAIGGGRGPGWSVVRPAPSGVDKVDLLFVIDDSRGMAARQGELARHVPEMLTSIARNDPDARSNVLDLHVGVITSSLGSFGLPVCATSNDHGHLLPRARQSGCGFEASPLTWAFGRDDIADVDASCAITSARESGCEYEAPWEALYHFLIDPAPYARAEVACTLNERGEPQCGSNKIVVEGIDEALLAQRKSFLRPDSFLAIVMLSDENDASLKPAGLNWLPWGYPQNRMQRGWSACANVPDDFEPETTAEFIKLHDKYKCFSCFEKGGDPACELPWPTEALNADVDAPRLRAFGHVQRYGYNFLWERQRYVDGILKSTVLGSDGRLAANPIYSGGFRTQDLVLVATIVGAPPALVSKHRGLTDDDWAKLVGPIGQRDPHMIESIAPRIVGDRDIPNGDDLQYACVDPRGAGAYPGSRHLRIVKELGISGMVASVCEDSYKPALLAVAQHIRGVVQRDCQRTSLAPDASGRVRCMFLEVLREGEARRCEELGSGICTPGAEPCRKKGTEFPPVSIQDAADAIYLPVPDGTSFHGAQGRVENGRILVENHLVCELMQYEAPLLSQCISEILFSPATGGWCYSQNRDVIDPYCRALGSPGTTRFFGAAEPRVGSQVYPFCIVGS